MLYIVVMAVTGAVLILWVVRRQKLKGLDYLGTVSERWIADERASSHDGLR